MTRRRSIVDSLGMLFDMHWAAAVPWESFLRGSDRILRLLADGLTDRHIADVTGMSPRTVSRRIAEMMEAAGVHSRFQLGVKYALRELE